MSDSPGVLFALNLKRRKVFVSPRPPLCPNVNMLTLVIFRQWNFE